MKQHPLSQLTPSKTARWTSRWPLISALVLGLGASSLLAAGCANSTPLRGRIAGLTKLTERAEANGAMRCAPRELALARANLLFAELELEQGFVSRASDHLAAAEPNAHAADELSVREKCTDLAPLPPPPTKPKPKLKPAPGDKDGDGYLDPEDKCPEEPENYDGFEDGDGCPDDPDTDGDGVKDSLDQCVLEPEDADSFQDADGCPEPDNDLDGVVDATDKCPLDPEDPDSFEDGDGCPEPDNDKDTVADAADECPNTPGDPKAEKPGCPSKPALAFITDCEVKITEKILFETGRAAIQKVSYPIVDTVFEIMKKNPEVKLEVQGHTDDRGGRVYNKKLSQDRSGAVVKYLVQKGIDPGRLVAKGYGFDKPLVENNSDGNRALNRRVQFIRTEGDKPGCGAAAPTPKP